jgi:2-methylisocitrate lyase-like PEP mutase family enzyme/ketosteroid isomerase-like protein
MKSFETFLQLHRNSTPLLLGNIWDVNSARMFERAGYKAIGTSSQAVAKTFGYEDGEKLPFETLFQVAKRVVGVINIPFTVDIEGGYSRSASEIAAKIEKLHDAGVVGVNLEDTVAGPTRQLQPVMAFQKILAAVAEHIARKNLGVFINVRTDAFLLGMPAALAETLARIKCYENTGAHGIFVPCITDSNDIKEVVGATTLPVNVMCMPELPGFDELKSLGVKRISTGPFVSLYADKKAEDAVVTISKAGNFSGLFGALILLVGFSCLLGSCTYNKLVTRGDKMAAATKPTVAEAKKAIGASNEVYFSAFEKNDSSAFLNSYAKDACILAPGAPPACGQQEAALFFRASYDSYGLRGGKFITTAVYADGEDYVTEEGRWQSIDAKGELFDHGKYLVLCKKTPEGWKMFRDAFSSDQTSKH